MGFKAVGLASLVFVAANLIYVANHLNIGSSLQLESALHSLWRVYMFGLPYTLPSFSDLSAFVLLYFFGTNVDTSSSSFKSMFFIVPALALIPRTMIFGLNSLVIDSLNGVSFLWALFYTWTPFLITTATYY